MGGSAEHLRPAANRQTKRGLAGVALSHLQQANGEIGAHQCIVWSQRQCASIGIRGGDILSVHQKRAGEGCQEVQTVRCKLPCLRQDRERPGTVIELQMEARQIQLQIDALGCERQRAFDHADRIAKLAIARELSGQFLEGGQEWRPFGSGTAQQRDSLSATPGGAQRCAKQRFDGWVVVAAGRLLERRNRFLCALLSEQGLGQDRHGSGIGSARSQNFRRQLLGFAKRLHPQREGGAFKQPGVRMDVTAGYVWHWNN